MAGTGGERDSFMGTDSPHPHGDLPTKDGYPLWSAYPSVAQLRSRVLMEALINAGVTVDEWADAIGLKGEYVKTLFRQKDVTNHLDACQVETTCKMIGVSDEYLRMGIVTQPFVGGITEPTDATSACYAPEKLVEAYAKLDDEERSKVTTYISDMLMVHELFCQKDKEVRDYESRLTQIKDGLCSAMWDEAATVDDLRDAIFTALYPPRQWAGEADLGRFNPMMASDYDDRYEETRRKLIPRGRPKGSGNADDADARVNGES